MVLATIIFCVAGQPTNCPVKKQFRIEPRGCHLGTYQAELPHQGRWVKATVRIVCK